MTNMFSLTLLATVDDWRRVADHVHWDTIVVAVKPKLTLPPTIIYTITAISGAFRLPPPPQFYDHNNHTTFCKETAYGDEVKNVCNKISIMSEPNMYLK